MRKLRNVHGASSAPSANFHTVPQPPWENGQPSLIPDCVVPYMFPLESNVTGPVGCAPSVTPPNRYSTFSPPDWSNSKIVPQPPYNPQQSDWPPRYVVP